MNTISSQAKRSTCKGAVPLPWEVVYQFGRVICLGFLATLGVTPGASGEASTQARGDALRTVLDHPEGVRETPDLVGPGIFSR